MIKQGWIPPMSPHFLIQEAYVHDEWMLLIVCMFLNCTTRKQVEKVLPEFTRKFPTPQTLVASSLEDITDVIRPLGFGNRRAKNIVNMTTKYLAAPWEHAKELPGVGEYAARAWEIFCAGEIGEDLPNDHALKEWYIWFTSRG